MTDLEKYKDSFFSEAKALIKTMNSALMELEKDPAQKNMFQDLYRAVHTLKSLASMMDYQQATNLCHTSEDLLELIRNNKIKLNKCVDLLFKSFDSLHADLKELETNAAELDLTEIITELKQLSINGKQIENEKQLPDTKEIKLSIEKINAIEVKVERLDLLINLAEELLIGKMRLDSIRETVEHTELSATIEYLGRLISELQFNVMQIRLVPIEFMFERFQRMARDIAKQQHKELQIEIVGGDIEVDRLVIDEISESIAHLIRNAIDHGLETPDKRTQLNKPAQGTIRLSASRSKEVVTIEIIDDGAGLNLAAVKETAIKRGILAADAKEKEVIESIFAGLSTKKIPTKISGRGLGLAIVKQKIESIGGNIRAASTPDKGTRFTIELPLSIAIIRTLFVKVDNELYAIPIEFVERLLVVTPDDFKGLMNDEAIVTGNSNMPVIHLAQLFNKKVIRSSKQSVVVIRKGEERIGLVVDSLLSTQEVVIKPLGMVVRNNRFFSGAALIGSGKMVLILDVGFLLQMQTRTHSVERL